MSGLGRWWIGVSIVGVVAMVGCGTGNGSNSTGCVEASSESASNPGTTALYMPCGAGACSCAAGQTDVQIAACASGCTPLVTTHSGVTGPVGTCISFDAATFYCSRICNSNTDCGTGGTCAFGPVHEVGGVVIDPTMYCVKN